MIIRLLNRNDVDEHNKVSSSSFIWQVAETDDDLPDAMVLGAFKDDNKTLMSNFECIPFSTYFEKSALNCLGIGGVATKPEYRRGGLVRSLFDEAFKMSPEYGWDYSLLSPFSTTYYRKFGYEPILWHINAKAETTVMSNIERCFDVELVTPDNVSKLITLYNDIAKSTNLLVVRRESKDFFHKPYTECEYTYMYKKDGAERGFISYKIDRPTSRIVVNELYFYDKEALLGLLGFLRVYEGNLKYIEFAKLSANSPVIDAFKEPRAFTITLSYGNSGRILNMENVLKAKKYPKQYGKFSFLSIDDVPACKGVFTVEYENGECVVERSDNKDYDFSVNAPAAARLFLAGEGLSEQLLSYVDGFNKKGQTDDFIRAFPRAATDFNKGF